MENAPNHAPPPNDWPSLDWGQWRETAETLQLFTQIVGKTRVALTPVQNHWWNVPLYVTACGLGTSAMPLPRGEAMDVEFNFVAHELTFRTSYGRVETMPLRPRTVADFFGEYQRTLAALGVDVALDRLPVEGADPIRFDLDEAHRSYDADAAHRFWRALLHADVLLEQFSTGFYGKVSPVHFFWGSFDLAVTRFNGRRAPGRPGADAIQSEAYSHECISAGFWPGNGGYGRAAFYCYAAPVPDGLAAAAIAGPGAFNKNLGEFVLDYEEVRRSADPQKTVLEFLQSTYAAAADAAGWDRARLDRTDATGELAARRRKP